MRGSFEERGTIAACCPSKLSRRGTMSPPDGSAFLIPEPVPGRRMQIRSFGHSARSHICTCSSSPQSPLPAKDSSVGPHQVKTTGKLPLSLHNTTVLHNVPSQAPHLADSPAHPLDGDGYILALSYQSSGAVWPRARFARTKAFMAESKAGQRIYRGTHGTPGGKGWQAPLKPKANSADGVFLWGRGKKRRAFAFGARSLPIALNLATLVARGPTALGNVLTDSPELVSERATELTAAPSRCDENLLLLGLSRNATGKVLGAFVVEIDRDYHVKKRLPRVDIPAGCMVTDFAAAEKFCVVLLHRELESSNAGGVFGSLLGLKSDSRLSPQLDEKFGSFVIVVPLDGSAASSFQMPQVIFTGLDGVDETDTGQLRIGALSWVSSNMKSKGRPTARRSTFTDLQIGQYWRINGNASDDRVRRRNFVVKLSTGGNPLPKPLEVVLEDDDAWQLGDISLLCPARSQCANSMAVTKRIYTTVEHLSGKAGLVSVDSSGTSSRIASQWTAEDTSCLVSGPLLCKDGRYVSVLVTAEGNERQPARVMVFDIESIERGPVHTTELDAESFGRIGFSMGGVWEDEGVDWGEDGSRPVKSSYEIFDSRKWNDIDSGFSSLGLNQ